MNKVYCKDCKYIQYGAGYIFCNEKHTVSIDTPHQRYETSSDIEIKNKNNNCKYYKKR